MNFQQASTCSVLSIYLYAEFIMRERNLIFLIAAFWGKPLQKNSQVHYIWYQFEKKGSGNLQYGVNDYQCLAGGAKIYKLYKIFKMEKLYQNLYQTEGSSSKKKKIHLSLQNKTRESMLWWNGFEAVRQEKWNKGREMVTSTRWRFEARLNRTKANSPICASIIPTYIAT